MAHVPIASMLLVRQRVAGRVGTLQALVGPALAAAFNLLGRLSEVSLLSEQILDRSILAMYWAHVCFLPVSQVKITSQRVPEIVVYIHASIMSQHHGPAWT
jgi:hypothetical protein